GRGCWLRGGGRGGRRRGRSSWRCGWFGGRRGSWRGWRGRRARLEQGGRTGEERKPQKLATQKHGGDLVFRRPMGWRVRGKRSQLLHKRRESKVTLNFLSRGAMTQGKEASTLVVPGGADAGPRELPVLVAGGHADGPHVVVLG